jgi:hypothetical protein
MTRTLVALVAVATSLLAACRDAPPDHTPDSVRLTDPARWTDGELAAYLSATASALGADVPLVRLRSGSVPVVTLSETLARDHQALAAAIDSQRKRLPTASPPSGALASLTAHQARIRETRAARLFDSVYAESVRETLDAVYHVLGQADSELRSREMGALLAQSRIVIGGNIQTARARQAALRRQARKR